MTSYERMKSVTLNDTDFIHSWFDHRGVNIIHVMRSYQCWQITDQNQSLFRQSCSLCCFLISVDFSTSLHNSAWNSNRIHVSQEPYGR